MAEGVLSASLFSPLQIGPFLVSGVRPLQMSRDLPLLCDFNPSDPGQRLLNHRSTIPLTPGRQISGSPRTMHRAAVLPEGPSTHHPIALCPTCLGPLKNRSGWMWHPCWTGPVHKIFGKRASAISSVRGRATRIMRHHTPDRRAQVKQDGTTGRYTPTHPMTLFRGDAIIRTSLPLVLLGGQILTGMPTGRMLTASRPTVVAGCRGSWLCGACAA